MLIAPPECDLKSGWTANDTSTHHLITPTSSTSSTSGRYNVFLTYRRTLLSFPQSSSSGALTLVVRNDTAVKRSRRQRIMTNNNCATA
mmetsp:Transcript_4536/g.9781  ORF Transcript_4536/g.9781 Transcript_4536/m.9781 type:complete len:88 (-) Transcript_4536:10-273(-)